MQRIRPGLYLLEAAWPANCYLIEGPRGLALFDTGHPQAAGGLADELTENGFALKDIEAVVISHGHFHHAGGAHGLQRLHRMKIFAHPADIPAIQGRDAGRAQGLFPAVRGLLRKLTSPYKPVGRVIPLERGQTLGALPHWQILAAPGHSRGSLCLFHPAGGVLLAGDALDNREGRLALPSSSASEDASRARESAGHLAALDMQVLGCGHGPVIRVEAGLKVRTLLAAQG